MKKYSAKVILNPGDALFIPEGWYVIKFCAVIHLVKVLFLGPSWIDRNSLTVGCFRS